MRGIDTLLLSWWLSWATCVHARFPVKSTGNLKILVIPLSWSDRPSSRTLAPISELEEIWNGVGVSDLIPSGSLANWTRVNSHGRLSIEATVTDWVTADNTESYYAAGRSAVPNAKEAGTVQLDSVVYHALRVLENSGFDFSDFDQDNDGYIDAIAILHSGYAAELGGEDCSNGRPVQDRIQSQMQVATIDGGWRGPNGLEAGSYIVASAFVGRCNSETTRIGTIAHEMVHLFQMPELYDVAGPYGDSIIGVGGLGAFDVMANHRGQGNLLAWPGHLSPWPKIQMGWVEPVEITADGIYTLRPSELYPEIYVISSPYPDGEYLAFEVRRPILFDGLMWEPGGLLIYHIDDNAPGPGNQLRGFPGQSGWPGNGHHYVAALLQQDGEYDLEKAVDNGGIADFWAPGTTLGPGNGELVANTATYPNTDSYAFGDIQVTGLVITNIQDEADGSVRFEVQGLGVGNGGGNGFPNPSPMPPSSPTQSPPTSQSGGGPMAPTSNTSSANPCLIRGALSLSIITAAGSALLF